MANHELPERYPRVTGEPVLDAFLYGFDGCQSPSSVDANVPLEEGTGGEIINEEPRVSQHTHVEEVSMRPTGHTHIEENPVILQKDSSGVRGDHWTQFTGPVHLNSETRIGDLGLPATDENKALLFPQFLRESEFRLSDLGTLLNPTVIDGEFTAQEPARQELEPPKEGDN